MKYGIITDDTVASLYGEQYADPLFIFPHGEHNKTRATKEMLEDQLFEAGFNKESTLIGLGGGVVCDMAGFIASTFCRGVPLILIPTTLLAMVDASIGGKNGLNTPFGKNLIGTIHHPKEVQLDLAFLKTLPENEMRQGLAEMVKHGFLNEPYMQLLLKEGVTEKTIRGSVDVKREWIQKNRDALNFGHTVGHALEKESNYTISHGDAISIGMAAESFYDPQVVELLTRFHLPTEMPPFDIDNLIQHMRRDKKNVGGKICFSLKGVVEEEVIRCSLR